MSDDEFWKLTLRQFFALLKRQKVDKEQSDYRAALVCSVVANCRMRGKGDDKVFTPDDFMPQRGKEKPKQQTAEQMLHACMLINAAMGGQIMEV